MPEPELITIGVLARSSGLTASALRFYADSGVLEPSTVDPTSGYRYYTPAQAERAVLIRRLREMEMPLDRVAEVLAAGAQAASAIIDEHLAHPADRVERARATAAAVRAALAPASGPPPVRLGGAVFTHAVEQVLTATIHEPGLPVLNGVHLEARADGLVLTATDRYRLSTRTLVVELPGGEGWSVTADADGLRLLMPWTRRQHSLAVHPSGGGLRIATDTEARDCRTLAATFPDWRLLLASLPETRTRALIGRDALRRVLEEQPERRVRFRLPAGGAAVTVRSAGAETRSIPAVLTGPAIDIDFDLPSLYPAISTAVGPDVLIDLAAPDLPVVVRSAADGDLTTLVMPLAPDTTVPSTEGNRE
ncbi:hypothetical protein CFN78_25725 [Amycolatopsis antarctica]|uniref:HTH merR-type domain-containing protein n=1 Tax=Amycolatopsis antarctica TaxID=1854586 RepID=A0A263CYB9_9PSEU|nr:MerR family transcriptional regulator [Amycolatopsis antarctica]OZM70326.1 hypothetical protein CFN78_25725 [Amycolatopsis antarctica]